MNRLDRLQAILTTLQSKRIVRAEELADRFDVSLRTIYRDMRALEAGGVPIGAEAGIGYFIGEGYHIPPVMFTREEGQALLLAGKMVDRFTDKSVAKDYNDALTKVRSVLDLQKKDELESLDKDILINPFPGDRDMSNDSLHMNKIKSSLSGSLLLEIEYFSRGKGEETKRVVEPIGLTFYAGQWHLIAWCRMREDYRDFRLDRIARLKLLNERYKRFRHPRLREYIIKLISEAELELCTIEVDKSIVRYLDDAKYRMGLIREEDKGEVVEMQFAAYSIENIARSILMMGNHVKIISPSSLEDRIKVLVGSLNEHYL